MIDRERIGDEAWVLRRYASARSRSLLAAIDAIAERAPFRRMTVPGGREMSVAMTNCGPLGWVSDRRGYRYADHDPETGLPWPPMPETFASLAGEAAAAAGFAGFEPDACLVNRYEVGARLSLHQDRDEASFEAPIVSVSLGLPATFLFGGTARNDPTTRIPLSDGDVVVWGGVDRLRYHGVLALKTPRVVAAAARINLTFRCAG